MTPSTTATYFNNATVQEHCKQGATFWEIGPYHPALPGPFVLQCALQSDRIQSIDLKIGYTHKGFYLACQNKSWPMLLPVMNHLSCDNGFFLETAWCQAIEKCFDITPPLRAQWIRWIMKELSRIINHLNHLARLTRFIGTPAVFHYIMRDREIFLDIIELITGMRFSCQWNTYGGVRYNLTQGALDRIWTATEKLQARIKEYNDLLLYQPIFKHTATGIGILHLKDAQAMGITGPVLRSFGVDQDARKHEILGDKLCSEWLNFGTPLAESSTTSDVYHRTHIHIKEILQSMKLLRQALQIIDPLQDMPLKNEEAPMHLQQREDLNCSTSISMESHRGVFRLDVTIEKGSLSHFSIQSPSVRLLESLTFVLHEEPLENIGLILHSMNFSINEVDL